MDYLVGRTLGQYRIVEPIGAGARGTVFRAEQVVLRQPRAVKIPNPKLADEPGFLDRFLREARLAAALHHPNIIQVYDADVYGGYHYIAMELLSGTSLAELIRTEGILPDRRAMNLLRQVAGALDYAHRVDPAGVKPQVVHRDVKPENVMVGPGDHVTLVDFGIARATQGTVLTGAGALVGSAPYIAPEVIRGESAGPGADLYSLGIVAYELLTGRVPFPGPSLGEIMEAHVSRPPPPPRSIRPGLPPAVDAVLTRQLAKEPRSRYPDGATFVEALASALANDDRAALTATIAPAAPVTAPLDPPAPTARQRAETPTEELPVPTDPTRRNPELAPPRPTDPQPARTGPQPTPTGPQTAPTRTTRAGSEPPPARVLVRAGDRPPPRRPYVRTARRPWPLYALILGAFLLAIVGLALLWPLVAGTNRPDRATPTPAATAIAVGVLTPTAGPAGALTATPAGTPSVAPALSASPTPPTTTPTASPTATPSPAATETPAPPTPTAAAPTPASPPRFGLRVDAPVDRTRVPREIVARGVQTAPRPPGTHLWLFVSAQVPGSRWYPCPRGELVTGPDQAWSCALYLGGPSGTRHAIVLGLVDDRTSDTLSRYIAANPNEPIFPDSPTPALPPGFAEEARIEVTVQ